MLISISFLLAFNACTKKEDSQINIEQQKKQAATKQLYIAIVDNDIATVRQSIQSGYNINEKIYVPEGEITPLLTALIYKRDAIAEYLISQKASLDGYYNGYSIIDFVYHHYTPKDSVFTLVKLQTSGATK
jgi:hypothetical protein